MIVYQETKAGFLRDAFTRDIEEVILAAFKKRTGHAVARSEVRSWKESLIAVAKVVNDASVPDDAGVGIEYGIPQTSKRIDFILSGTREDFGEKPWRASGMIEFNPTEYSGMRLQYNHDKSGRDGKTNHEWFLQFIMGIGAHAAHPF